MPLHGGHWFHLAYNLKYLEVSVPQPLLNKARVARPKLLSFVVCRFISLNLFEKKENEAFQNIPFSVFFLMSQSLKYVL